MYAVKIYATIAWCAALARAQSFNVQALIDGVTTLEMDNGVTKDGQVIVGHDEFILGTKCRDIGSLNPDDAMFPYVGKRVADLTLAQIKTLDCGSQRQAEFLDVPLKISTLTEVFDFVRCAEPQRYMNFHIESKINPLVPGATRSSEDFVNAQWAVIVRSGYTRALIQYSSLDWRSLILMKQLEPRILISALADSTTVTPRSDGSYPWLAGVNLSNFSGRTLGARVAQAAGSIQADILSPRWGQAGQFFTTRDMVDEAHRLGMTVIPYNLNVAEALIHMGVDEMVTDYPVMVRRLAQQYGRTVSRQHAEDKVMKCLAEHIQRL